jgi:hypothetical protein
MRGMPDDEFNELLKCLDVLSTEELQALRDAVARAMVGEGQSGAKSG